MRSLRQTQFDNSSVYALASFLRKTWLDNSNSKRNEWANATARYIGAAKTMQLSTAICIHRSSWASRAIVCFHCAFQNAENPAIYSVGHNVQQSICIRGDRAFGPAQNNSFSRVRQRLNGWQAFHRKRRHYSSSYWHDLRASAYEMTSNENVY